MGRKMWKFSRAFGAISIRIWSITFLTEVASVWDRKWSNITLKQQNFLAAEGGRPELIDSIIDSIYKSKSRRRPENFADFGVRAFRFWQLSLSFLHKIQGFGQFLRRRRKILKNSRLSTLILPRKSMNIALKQQFCGPPQAARTPK